MTRRRTARAARAAIGLLALLGAPARAAGPEELPGVDPFVRDPLPDGAVVEVTPGVASIVEVGEYAHAEVLEARDVTIDARGAGRLDVLPAGAGARGLVLLWGADGGVRTLVIRATPPPPPPSLAVGAAKGGASPYTPELLARGDYIVTGTEGDAPRARMIHQAGWRQELPGHRLEADVVVEKNPAGPWALQRAILTGEGPWWGGTLGDVSLSATGDTMMGIPLRGGRFEFHTPERDLSVALVGGAGRSWVCCDYFNPRELAATGLSAQWRPFTGFQVDGVGSVLFGESVGRPTLFGGGSVAYSNHRVRSLIGVSTVSGGASANASLWLRNGSRWSFYTEGAWRDGRFRIANLVEGPVRREALARVGGGWEITRAVGFTAEVEGRLVDPIELFEQDLRQIQGDVALRVRPVEPLWLSALYRHTTRQVDLEVQQSDQVGFLASVRPSERLTTGASTTLGFGADTLAWAAGAWLRYAERGAGSLEGRYDVSEMGWGGKLAHRALVYGVIDRATWRLGVGSQLQIRPTKPTVQLRPWLEGAWVPHEWVTLRLSSSLDVPIGGGLGWTVAGGWEVRPRPGDGGEFLGFRGGIEGLAFLDLDRDGVLDDGEEGLPGIRVTLTEQGAEAVTDDQGRFRFTRLPPDLYHVVLDREAWRSLDGVQREVQVVPLGSADLTFALAWGARLGGRAYVDVDGNGAFDGLDYPAPVGSILVRESKGRVVANLRPEQGRWDATGLAPDTYTVFVDEFSIPPGYVPLDAMSVEIPLGEGEPREHDFRFAAQRSIAGVVWQDLDGDGKASRGDLGLGGVDVALSNGRTVRTGPDGSYRFDNLAPGAYSVTTPLTEASRTVVLDARPGDVAGVDFFLRTDRILSSRDGAVLTGLAVTSSSPVLPLGLEMKLKATVVSGGRTLDVTSRAVWSSSDPNVLAVVGPGRVRAVGTGRVALSASLDGMAAVPVEVQVIGEGFDLALVPTLLELRPGDAREIKATAAIPGIAKGEVTSIATWVAADPTVAVFEEPGVVRAVKDGVTEVWAQLGAQRSAPATVTVMTPDVTVLQVEGLPARMPVGSTVQLTATGYDQGLGLGDVSSTVTWESSDPSALEIDASGRARALRPGVVRVTARIASLVSPERTVAITNAAPNEVRIRIDVEMPLAVGDRVPLQAIGIFDGGERGAVTGVGTWQVDGHAVAVGSDGVLVALEPGVANVTVTYQGVRSEPLLVVVEPKR